MKTEIVRASMIRLETGSGMDIYHVSPGRGDYYRYPDFVGIGSPHLPIETEIDLFIQPHGNARDLSVEYLLVEGVSQWLVLRKMIKVQGVGLRSACQMLWVRPWNEIRTLINGKRFAELAGLPKFRTKTGKKVIDEVFGVKPDALQPDEDAVDTLKVMGHKAGPAKEAVLAAMKDLPSGTTEELVKAALKKTNV